MAYPSTIDSPTTNVDDVDVIYASDVNNLQTAVVALETKVGVDSSAVTTSHDYKLGEVTSTDKAVGKTATQTLTNKTLTSPTITTPEINGTPTGTFVVPVANGGTGQITANAGLNALIPSQTGNSGKYLGTDGSNTSWNTLSGLPYTISYLAGENITAGQPLHYTTYSQLTTPITFNTQASGSFGSGTSNNVSINVGNNTNRVLLVDIITPSGNAVSVVTFNSVAMTLVDTQTLGGAAPVQYQYKLIAPSIGTFNVNIASAGAYGGSPMNVNVNSYYNVDQTTPIEVTNKSTAAASGITLAVTSLTGSAVVHSGAAGSVTTGTGGITFASINGLNKIDNEGQLNLVTANSPISETTQSISVNSTHSADNQRGIINSVLKPSTLNTTAVVKADSRAGTVFTSSKQNFIGFANQTVSFNNQVSIDASGVNNDQSSLSIGTYYYLQDTAGTLGTTAGTVSKIVGKTISATEIVIIP